MRLKSLAFQGSPSASPLRLEFRPTFEQGCITGLPPFEAEERLLSAYLRLGSSRWPLLLRTAGLSEGGDLRGERVVQRLLQEKAFRQKLQTFENSREKKASDPAEQHSRQESSGAAKAPSVAEIADLECLSPDLGGDLPPSILCLKAASALEPLCMCGGSLEESPPFEPLPRRLVCSACSGVYAAEQKEEILAATRQNSPSCAGCPHQKEASGEACKKNAAWLAFFSSPFLALQAPDSSLKEALLRASLPLEERFEIALRVLRDIRAFHAQGVTDLPLFSSVFVLPSLAWLSLGQARLEREGEAAEGMPLPTGDSWETEERLEASEQPPLRTDSLAKWTDKACAIRLPAWPTTKAPDNRLLPGDLILLWEAHHRLRWMEIQEIGETTHPPGVWLLAGQEPRSAIPASRAAWKEVEISWRRQDGPLGDLYRYGAFLFFLLSPQHPFSALRTELKSFQHAAEKAPFFKISRGFEETLAWLEGLWERLPSSSLLQKFREERPKDLEEAKAWGRLFLFGLRLCVRGVENFSLIVSRSSSAQAIEKRLESELDEALIEFRLQIKRQTFREQGLFAARLMQLLHFSPLSFPAPADLSDELRTLEDIYLKGEIPKQTSFSMLKRIEDQLFERIQQQISFLQQEISSTLAEKPETLERWLRRTSEYHDLKKDSLPLADQKAADLQKTWKQFLQDALLVLREQYFSLWSAASHLEERFFEEFPQEMRHLQQSLVSFGEAVNAQDLVESERKQKEAEDALRARDAKKQESLHRLTSELQELEREIEQPIFAYQTELKSKFQEEWASLRSWLQEMRFKQAQQRLTEIRQELHWAKTQAIQEKNQLSKELRSYEKRLEAYPHAKMETEAIQRMESSFRLLAELLDEWNLPKARLRLSSLHVAWHDLQARALLWQAFQEQEEVYRQLKLAPFLRSEEEASLDASHAELLALRPLVFQDKRLAERRIQQVEAAFAGFAEVLRLRKRSRLLRLVFLAVVSLFVVGGLVLLLGSPKR